MGDLITQLQDSNAELCSLFFNYTGAIQRDARPLAVNEEPVEGAGSATAGPDTMAQIPELASQVRASRHVRPLHCNPPTRTSSPMVPSETPHFRSKRMRYLRRS